MPAGPRVVRLLPSATEIVRALGRADALVGVSHDHPPQVLGRPVLASAEVRPSASSREIDRDVGHCARADPAERHRGAFRRLPKETFQPCTS